MEYRPVRQEDLEGILASCDLEDWTSYTDNRNLAWQAFNAPGTCTIVAMEVCRSMFSPILAKVFQRRAKKNQQGHLGRFEVEYVDARDEDFNLGINYHQCGNLDFVMRHGGEEFAPYICMWDITLSDALGWCLTRTQTLADGCQCCDFRFKKGAKTQISSKTPEVQETMERIRKKEAQQSLAAEADKPGC